MNIQGSVLPNSGGTRLYSQHLGGRDRQISEFEASLVYRASSRTARETLSRKIFKKEKKKQVGKERIYSADTPTLLFITTETPKG